MRAAAVLLVLVLAVGLVPETEGFWGFADTLLDTVSNIFGKRRRRGLQDIIGMSKEDKQAACEKLGKPGPVNADLVQSIFNHVDARKDTGSVGDGVLNSEEIALFIGSLEVLDYCEQNQDSL